MVPAFFRCFPALGFLAAAALAAHAADGSAPGGAPRLLAPAPVPGGEGELRLAIIVTRHGVRSSLRDENAVYGSYSAQRWPGWEVPRGCLTPHGKRQMELMGAYYRGRYAGLGLISGRTAEDEGRIFFRADSDQRTIETARDLGVGLIPGGHAGIHARRLGEPDPLFEPVKAGLAHPDPSVAAASVLGRIGGDPAAIVTARAAAFATLERILLGGDGRVPPGKKSLLELPSAVAAYPNSDTVAGIQGPLLAAMRCTDTLILEYADAMPMPDVGWGRVSRRDLTELLGLHSLYFDLTQSTLYPARMQGSNLAGHILQTLDQAAGGRPVRGAIGTPEDRLVLLVGHDTNLANLAGLLGVSWWIEGTQENPVLPGGALVFELWRNRGDGRMFVRMCHISQTLDQMRSGEALTPGHPPAIAPVFIPECSSAAPGYDAPLDRFEARLRRAMDPGCVAADAF